jgi:signal transduction histidine kinase
MFEKVRSKIIIEIALLIIIEIAFIISSSAILVYFQSNDSSLGNSINIAGKNRYLTANLFFETQKYVDSPSSSNLQSLKNAMNNLDSNILALKQGGIISGINVTPLQQEFSNLWNTIDEKWQNYKAFIMNNVIETKPKLTSQSVKAELESKGRSLISSSDLLVVDLGKTTERNSKNLILLEIALGILNIGILMLILYLVRRILRPIFALTAATAEVKKGNLNVSVKEKGSDELSILSRSFNSMMNSIKNYIKTQNELSERLEKTNEQLKTSNRLKEEFVNIAAHELRTPIQPILSLSQIIRPKVDLEQQELLDIVIRNSKRLQHLTEDLLDVTKIESNSLKLNIEQFDLIEVIADVVKDYRSEIEKSNTKISVLYEPSNGIIMLEADRSRVNQVISNLLGNAIKFTKQGEITINVYRPKSNKNNQVGVSMIDNGSGINPEIFPRLFTKFVTMSDQGTGLGLFVSKSIIEAHGGKMWAENRNTDGGKGAKFTFVLPITNKLSNNFDKQIKNAAS